MFHEKTLLPRSYVKSAARLFFLMMAGLMIGTVPAYAAIRTETVEYRDRDAVLEGYLAYNDDSQTRMPGVLIIHEWTGLGPYVEKRAEQIASLGYVAFAADIYGKGIRPSDPKDAAAQSAIYKKDRALMRERAMAGLKILQTDPLVDPSRIAVIGYCFGGTTALELARSGADLRGAVSCHGGLDTPEPGDAKNIKAKVLVLHGADDPHVPAKDLEAFENEMRDAGVDWQVVLYGGAVHSFTNPTAGSDPSKGNAYDAKADARSWEAMRSFLNEVFTSQGG